MFDFFFQVSFFDLFRIFEKFGEIYNIRDETIGQMNKFAVTFTSITIEMEQSFLNHMRSNKIYPNEYKGREVPCGASCIPGIDDTYVNHLDNMHLNNHIDGTHAIDANPPAADSPQNIVNSLNDDVLLQIFGEFDEIGLYTIANVCTRFREIAGQCFGMKYKELKYYNYKRYEPLSGMVKLIRIFGPYIKAIHLDLNYGSARVVPVMAAIHCTNLNELHLTAPKIMVVQKTVKRAVDQILPRLKVLSIKQYLVNMHSLVNSSCQLDTLRISDNEGELPKLAISIPSLRKLWLTGYDTVGNHIRQSLLMYNKQLKIVRLRNIESATSSMLQLLPNYLHNVQELDISFLHMQQNAIRNLDCWSKFINLKSLRIHGDPAFPVNLALKAFVEANVQIESINFNTYNIDNETVELICKMKTLTELTLKEEDRYDKYVTYIDYPKRLLFEHLESIRFEFFKARIDWIKSCLLLAKGLTEISINIYSSRCLKVSVGDVDAISTILDTRPGVKLHFSMQKVSEESY